MYPAADNPSDSLSDWMTIYPGVIDELRQSSTQINELLDDHTQLIKAINYWSGKSTERVEEFRGMAQELEQEIIQVVFAALKQKLGEVGPHLP